MNTINNNLYKYKIIELYEPLIKYDIEINNFSLCKIFEYYSAIKLTDTYNSQFIIFDDVDIDFKIDRELTKYDTGIDLINIEGNYYVQCKLRKNTLTWSEISTFLAHFFGIEYDVKAILTYNNDMSFSEQLNKKKHLLINYPICKNTMIDYCNSILKNKELILSKIKISNEYQERLYQTECINLIKNNNKNTIIHLPTGSGKTIIMALSIQPENKYLILVPRRFLLEQIKQKIIYIHPDYSSNIQLIGDNNNTNIDTSKSIFICVYNSIHHIIDNIKIFDKIFIDEAHNILKNKNIEDDDIEDDDIEDDEFNSSHIETIYNLQNYNNNVYFSATINKQPDMLYYNKNIRWMIDNNYLNDYQIKMPIFNNFNEKEICKYLVNTQKHCIIYVDNQLQGNRINNYLNELIPNCSAYIDCNTNYNIRNVIFNNYNKSKINFLVNIRVLIEGFDAPITDSVCLLHIPKSKIIIRQILGRTLRLYDTKTISSIIIPGYCHQDIINQSNLIYNLCNDDLKYNSLFSKKIYKGYINIEDYRIYEEHSDFIDNTSLLYEEIYDSFGSCLNREDKWKYNLEQIINYINKNNKLPSQHNKNEIIKKLGFWLCTQKNNYKNNCNIMKDENIRKLWEDFTEKYKQYFITNEELWKYNLEEIINYINKNNKLPSTKSKDKEERFLGIWLGTQKQNYKNNRDIMKYENIRNLWEHFIEQYKQYFIANEELWKYNLEEIINYINKNNKLPTKTSKNEIIKKLGNWLGDQKKNYKNNCKIMKNENIRKIWEDFTTKKYKQYFITNEELWKNNLEEIINYINKNNKLPSQHNKNEIIKKLGQWLGTQKNNYKNNCNIMKDENIRKIWEDFTTKKYKQYFITNEELWKNNLEEIINYINKNNKLPTETSKNEIIKNLGKWLGTQKQNYKKQNYIMKDNKIRKLWEDFIEEYKEYFMSNEELWKNNLEEIINYINKNNKLPTKTSKNEIIKKLGSWLGNQKQNYKNNRGIMKDENIRKIWEDFTTKKYKQYFMSK
jgi:superfamily II DNA or RNA helicase